MQTNTADFLMLLATCGAVAIATWVLFLTTSSSKLKRAALLAVSGGAIATAVLAGFEIDVETGNDVAERIAYESMNAILGSEQTVANATTTPIGERIEYEAVNAIANTEQLPRPASYVAQR